MQSFKYKGTPEQMAKVAEYMLTQDYKWDDYDREGLCLYVGSDGDMFYTSFDDGSISTLPPELELAIFGKTERITGKVENPWQVNEGKQPVGDYDLVDVKLSNGIETVGDYASAFQWGKDEGVTHWRLHKSDEDYFKMPETSSLTFGGAVNVPEDMPAGESTYRKVDGLAEDYVEIRDSGKPIDSHYSFTYTLTPEDIAAGNVKVDPYFVSKQWKLGSKDEAGILWHCLKTISRYGVKNSKEREVVALYKQIIRLAQLEGVSLEKV